MDGLGKRINTGYLLAIALIANPIYVKASITSDLYNAYGLEDTTELSKAEATLSNEQQKYDTAKSDYDYVIDYNRVLESLDIESLRKEKKDLKKQRKAVKKDIEKDGFYLSYDDLEKLYDKYNSLSKDINKVNKKLKCYENRNPIEVPNYDFQCMEDNIESLKDTIANLKIDSDIGDIENPTNFIQTTYCIKRRFDGTGTTLKALPDTGVLTPFSGNILSSERTSDKGEVIVLELKDNIHVTLYNLKARYVQSGDYVTQYQKIATTNDDLYITLQIGDTFYDIDKLFGGKTYE